MATRLDAFGYSPELGEAMCEAVASGGSIAAYCRQPNTPHAKTAWKWLARVPEFAALYQAARVIQADAFADAMIDIADGENDPAKVRNQMNARQWAAERANPGRFGAKAALELSGEVGTTVVIRQFTPKPEPTEPAE